MWRNDGKTARTHVKTGIAQGEQREPTAIRVCLMMMHVIGGNKGGNMAQGGLNE